MTTIRINDNYFRLSESYLFAEIEKRVKKSGIKDIINLGIGDATRPIPKKINKSYVKAAKLMGGKNTFKGYPPTSGYGFFKSGVKDRFLRYGVKLSDEEIFISDGAKTDLYAVLSLFSKSTALIHNPAYPAYEEANLIFGNEVKFIASCKKNGFLPTPNELNNLYGKSYLIYICSPDNPTGAVYDKEALKKWVDYALKTGSVIIFDSAYADYVRGDYPKSIFEIDGAEACAIEISSLSKTANFTGVRCGFTIIRNQLKLGGERANKVFERIKSATFNGVPYVSQVAGQSALENFSECLENTDYYLNNARLFKDFFNKKGVFAVGGENSPYVFFECPGGLKSFEFFDILLSKAGIVATPGVGFGGGGEGFIRISGFNSRKLIIEAIKRMDCLF